MLLRKLVRLGADVIDVGVAAVAAVGGAAAKGLRWIADHGTEPEASDEPSSAPGA